MREGGFTAGLSPDAVKTSIDAVAYEEYTREQQPGYLSALDSFFFKTDAIDKLAFIWDEDSNVGEFQITAEQEEILDTNSFIGNKTTKSVIKYTKQIPISDEAFRTDQHSKRAQIGKNVGDRARQTQDKQAILNTYADGFAGSINTTPDGQALYSNSHTTLTGVNVDNFETGALTADNAWTLAVSLASQKAQDGDAGSHVLEAVVVPFTLYKTAKEVFNSVLISGSAENNLNIFDTDYGNLMIRGSIFLGSQYNSNSNANTSYHFLGRNHMIMRKTLYGLTTTMINPEYTDNDTWLLRAKFAEVAFPGSWTATAGSNGSTN